MATATAKPETAVCQGCGLAYSSRNAVFKHLLETHGACLSAEEHADFVKYVVQKQERRKVLILYGYIVDHHPAEDENDATCRVMLRNGTDAAEMLLSVLERSQQEAEQQQSANSSKGTAVEKNADDNDDKDSSVRINRSYGHAGHSTDIVAQDDGTGAITEVLATKLSPLTMDVQCWIDWINEKLEQEMQNLRSKQQRESDSPSESLHSRAPNAHLVVLGRIDLPNSASRFNAEMDFSHRRVEYLLPVDFLFCEGQPAPDYEGQPEISKRLDLQPIARFFTHFPSFGEGNFCPNLGDDESGPLKISSAGVHRSKRERRPDHAMLLYMYSLKKMMQRLATPVVEIPASAGKKKSEKQNDEEDKARQSCNGTKPAKDKSLLEESSRDDFKRPKKAKKTGTDPKAHANGIEIEISRNDETVENHDNSAKQNGEVNHEKPKAEKKNWNKKARGGRKQKKSEAENDKSHMLKRKRYHNFTPTVMAHEYLAFRRLDRFYHRATLRFCSGDGNNHVHLTLPLDASVTERPFLLLSLSADLFLTGQVCRLVGLFIAMIRGVVDDDFLDCVFDEEYPHLVPTPPAPFQGMYAAEAHYVKWEGKLNTILTPRNIKNYNKGWNDSKTIERVEKWQRRVREHSAQSWLKDGIDDDGKLNTERSWTRNVLNPWAKRAREQLEHYRQWKEASRKAAAQGEKPLIDGTADDAMMSIVEVSQNAALSPPLEFVDPKVPVLYEKVLYYLREADASGRWPSTTPKRQLVMISTEVKDDVGNPADFPQENLVHKLTEAQKKIRHRKDTRSSAYIFAEGEGGASGSFSVGAMPGETCIQPKANTMFPELMKAAFELEIALRPDREPSSTIAINRNAQFRPHTDSGAGAGQSTSLIVGLGTYSGGELVVEGEKVDIRYKAIEFNGWKQRHWTMPFKGERFSLVWFTPKGCEGLRGIDLCQ